MSFAIPVKRLYETGALMAFMHPQPAYPLHILIVPKQAVPSLLDLQPGEAFSQAFFHDLLDCVRTLVQQFDLEKSGYRLIINGGEYQEVGQLHFHLVGELDR